MKLLETNFVYICASTEVSVKDTFRVPFLGPEDIKILILGAIWNFGKGTGLSCVDIRLWGTKGRKV
jgi:hypothetical protein